jgi:succinate dehydrogenase / fumarate reductase, membrane anchor subunit
MKNTGLASNLNTAKGLGSAKSGVHHWLVQRGTAIALLALMGWAVWAAAQLGSMNYEGAQQFLASPYRAVLAWLFLAAALVHAPLGVQVVVEDYVHCKAKKIALLLFIKGLSLGLLAMVTISLFYLVTTRV